MNDDSDELTIRFTVRGTDEAARGRPRLQDGGKITNGYRVCTGGCRRLTANRGGICNRCLKKKEIIR